MDEEEEAAIRAELGSPGPLQRPAQPAEPSVASGGKKHARSYSAAPTGRNSGGGDGFGEEKKRDPGVQRPYAIRYPFLFGCAVV